MSVELTTESRPAVERTAPPAVGLQRFVRGHISATLILGDSESIELPDADALVSDPPYGIAYKSPSGAGQVLRGDYPVIEGDDKPFDPRKWLAYPTVVLWGANHYASRLPDAPAWLVWDKRAGMKPNNNSDCELAWCNVGGSARLITHLWNGMLKDSEKDEKRQHPTQKPVAVMSWCLEKAKVPEGATVLDPYMGSGTTGIAAIRRGCNFVGIEKDPRYYAIAVRRIQAEINQGVLL